MSSDDDDVSWYFNGSKASLVPFLSRLPNSAKTDNPKHDRLVRRGTTSNSKGQECVHNKAHAYLLEAGLATEGTWSKPFPISGPTAAMTQIAIDHCEATRLASIAALRSAHAAATAAADPHASPPIPAPPAFAVPTEYATPIVAAQQLPMEPSFFISLIDILNQAQELAQLIAKRCTSPAVSRPLLELSKEREGITILVYLNSLDPNNSGRINSARRTDVWTMLMNGPNDASVVAVNDFDEDLTNTVDLVGGTKVDAETQAEMLIATVEHFGSSVKSSFDHKVFEYNALQLASTPPKPADGKTDPKVVLQLMRDTFSELNPEELKASRAAHAKAKSSLGGTDPRKRPAVQPAPSAAPRAASGGKVRKKWVRPDFSKPCDRPCPQLKPDGVKCGKMHWKRDCPHYKATLSEAATTGTGLGKANAGFVDHTGNVQHCFGPDGNLSESYLDHFLDCDVTAETAMEMGPMTKMTHALLIAKMTQTTMECAQ